MSAVDGVFLVRTNREDRPVVGGDTTIFGLPADFLVDIGTGPVLDVRRLGRLLRRISEKQAADLGEELHSAEFRLTTDPAVVSSFGILPEHAECAGCAEGVASALNLLRLTGAPLLVGRLWWAGE